MYHFTDVNKGCQAEKMHGHSNDFSGQNQESQANEILLKWHYRLIVIITVCLWWWFFKCFPNFVTWIKNKQGLVQDHRRIKYMLSNGELINCADNNQILQGYLYNCPLPFMFSKLVNHMLELLIDYWHADSIDNQKKFFSHPPRNHGELNFQRYRIMLVSWNHVHKS